MAHDSEYMIIKSIEFHDIYFHVHVETNFKWQLQLKLFFKTVIKPFADENAIIFRSGLLNKKILF